MKHYFIQAYSAAVVNKMERWKRNPLLFQEKIFTTILTRIKKSAYAREFGLTDIRTYEEFSSKAPLQTFETLKGWVEKIKNGEKNVLSDEEVLYLVMTSGTTSGKKFIPITRQGMQLYLNGMRDTFFNYVYKNQTYDLFDGKILTLTGNPRLEKMGAVHSGRVSCVLNHHVPWYLALFRLPSGKTNYIPDWELKMESIIHETLGQNVTAISGLPIWVQKYLDSIVEREHKPIGAVFPNLRVFIHGGLSIKPYYEHLFRLIDKKIDFVEVYNASEGFFAFQDELNDPGLLLHLNSGIFYEFIPVDALSRGETLRIPLAGVELGREYSVILNTYSGVLGYDLGDTVRFTSLNPYKIIWTGRTQHFTSAFNEHVIAEEVESAIGHAVAQTGLGVVEFTVAPNIDLAGEGAFYDWFIEFEAALTAEQRTKFAFFVDERIRAMNHVYRELRAIDILKMPRITCILKNGFYNYMKAQGKLGEQYKVPHLANDRRVVEDLGTWMMVVPE